MTDPKWDEGKEILEVDTGDEFDSANEQMDTNASKPIERVENKAQWIKIFCLTYTKQIP